MYPNNKYFGLQYVLNGYMDHLDLRVLKFDAWVYYGVNIFFFAKILILNESLSQSRSHSDRRAETFSACKETPISLN